MDKPAMDLNSVIDSHLFSLKQAELMGDNVLMKQVKNRLQQLVELRKFMDTVDFETDLNDLL